jgi:hypothetical protein
MSRKVPEHKTLHHASQWCHRAKVTIIFTRKNATVYFTRRPDVPAVAKTATAAIRKLRNYPLSAFDKK